MLEQLFEGAAAEISQGQHHAELAEAKLRHISAVKWDSAAGVNFKRRIEDMRARSLDTVQTSRAALEQMPGVIAGMASMDQDLRNVRDDFAKGFVESSARVLSLVQAMAEVGLEAPDGVGPRGIFNPISTT